MLMSLLEKTGGLRNSHNVLKKVFRSFVRISKKSNVTEAGTNWFVKLT